jgi:hypothetical protein
LHDALEVARGDVGAPPPDGYAALLSDGERNAEGDSSGWRDFPEVVYNYIIIYYENISNILH